jgi:hypothetical protein
VTQDRAAGAYNLTQRHEGTKADSFLRGFVASCEKLITQRREGAKKRSEFALRAFAALREQIQ